MCRSPPKSMWISSKLSDAPRKVQILGDFHLSQGCFYAGGYIFMLAHFALINSEMLDSLGIMGTGTTSESSLR